MARYFTKEEFDEGLDKERIKSVLNTLYKEEDIKPEHEMPIEFFMMSDTLDKLDEVEEILEGMGYDIDSSEQHDDGCELIAISTPMKMDLDTVVAWCEKMKVEGFKFDCKFDGWHVLID